MKTTILSLVLASIAGLMYCGDESLAVTQEPEDKELRALQESRRDTLKEVVAILDQAHQSGTIKVDEVLKANSALLEAELELATSQQERIAIFEKMLEAQTEIESSWSGKVNTGQARMTDLLTATAARIKTEIDLYKAKKGK